MGSNQQAQPGNVDEALALLFDETNTFTAGNPTYKATEILAEHISKLEQQLAELLPYAKAGAAWNVNDASQEMYWARCPRLVYGPDGVRLDDDAREMWERIQSGEFSQD